jgi:hypothetical protein
MNWKLLAVVLAAAIVDVAACKVSTGSSNGSGGDDGGDDGTTGDGAPCGCSTSSDSGVTISLTCNATACEDGLLYLCSSVGSFEIVSECGDAGMVTLPDACVPNCNGKCNTDDGCHGLCTCASGQTCVDFACTTPNPNCIVGLGQYCDIVANDAGSSSCCSTGYECADAGAATKPDGAVVGSIGKCCAEIGGGTCTVATDCCDYPAAQCVNTTTDAGPGFVCSM